jgi:hypothetical protein
MNSKFGPWKKKQETKIEIASIKIFESVARYANRNIM